MNSGKAADASNRHFQLTYFDPPEGLKQHVLALFHFKWDEREIADRHPGALGQLFFTPYGSGEIEFGDVVQKVGGKPCMFSGFKTAAPFRMSGPWHAIGASLSPLGWAALSGADASTHLDRFIPAEELLGDEVTEFHDDLVARYRSGETGGPEACAELAGWIAQRLKSVPKPHETVIRTVLAWLGTSLNPDIEALYNELAYSRRQSERLVAKYFGLAPAALARKMRAVRAAHLLAQPDLSDEAEAEIASAFYDQPHMINEIRRYCGYTPSRLGGEAEPLFQTMLRMKNLNRLSPFMALGIENHTA
ncbi:putative transcriptional regulator [Erythrobacter sp. NAP1]|uniref:helix-turn-helix domain-containing protein n=1 Tax=Erythrobacter sp. NAP1 TaxID=237727 RepID=UPI000068767A|nr:helix-turn-helix domain-containing protein [Erythrobacter sp. NAP1]EAQ28563.1 putative transcriptional regulator [Erythrobacter sp. NAP1]